MSFYRYLFREHYLNLCREQAAAKAREDRKRTREERRAREDMDRMRRLMEQMKREEG